MTDFSTKTTRLAMKPHKCEFCGKEIAKGETYERVFVVDGKAYDYALHTFCDSISQSELAEGGYEETTLDLLLDCARDKVLGEKNNVVMADFYGVTVEQITFVFGEVAA
jgi:hypothetical protein